MSSRYTALVASVLMLLVASCLSQTQPIHLSEDWPDKAGDYDDSSRAWTRRAILRAPISEQGSQLLELYATFLSTEWRAAYVQRQAERLKLSEASRKTLEQEQKQQAAETHQVKLLISTYHPEHNDLHRDQSIWRVVLVDEDGNEIPATSIEKDRRPRQLIAAEFPNLGDFAEAYLATFPHAPEILKGKKFSLRVSSSLGTVEVEWATR